jgi:CubicO group peptidase (beta-lactamase class C family)
MLASNATEVAMTVGVIVRDRAEVHHQRIGGIVTAGFSPVRDAFVDNFAVRGELGGPVCVVVAGEVVVDLWGGVSDQAGNAPWSADTMTLVHSTTKGLSAMVLALLHSRGLLNYDQRVAAY